jgi:hypothetical protein
MDRNELKSRTKDFAHRCVKLCVSMQEAKELTAIFIASRKTLQTKNNNK